MQLYPVANANETSGNKNIFNSRAVQNSVEVAALLYYHTSPSMRTGQLQKFILHKNVWM